MVQSGERDELKHAAYAADVTYGTNSEFGFDFLRDNLALSLEEKYQRDRSFAIVDEVDNILIDEARTPLIISGAPEQAADLYYRFAQLAPRLEPGKKPEGWEAKTKEWQAEYDYEPDEKHKTVAITERGVEKAERFLGIENLYLAEHGNLVNHLIQALKAESLYKRDVDYAVIDGEAKIIDEFTGRILEGRRWSEGLHQAVEAKEGVAIQEENQTVATITYQNYFRKYDKLAGMTGTALTEATEFMKIYELQVVEVPTNRPWSARTRTTRSTRPRPASGAPWPREIHERHQTGQPVLVGTISVEVSEVLSRQLEERGIPHAVLNAKPEFAELEGETIAEAGRPGAVTIATNMAGRGVDIKLGGNAEHLTHLELVKLGLEPGQDEYDAMWDEVHARVEGDVERAARAGGRRRRPVHPRHRAPRVAAHRQPASRPLRPPGRPGRVALLPLRRGRPRAALRRRPHLPHPRPPRGTTEEGEEEPIEAGMLTKQIENAQKKVEEQNFLIRKRVLEYDDVMNQQRDVIYEYRDRILEGEDISETAREQVALAVERLVQEYLPGDFVEEGDLDGLFTQLEQMYPTALSTEDVDPNALERTQLVEDLQEDVVKAYDEREQELGAELMRALERFVLLQIIDERWREHLHDMDYLREGIHLRGFAQIDPLVAYKNEGFEMFTGLMNAIWEEFARYIFHVEVEVERPGGGPGGARARAATTSWVSSTPAARRRTSRAPCRRGAGRVLRRRRRRHGAGARRPRGLHGGAAPRGSDVVGRNDPCPCGSGRSTRSAMGIAA